MSGQWYQLGLQLTVKTGALDRIRIQFQNPRDQLLEMLKIWLNTSDNTSWKTLIDALRSRSVGASQLAGVLERKHCVMESHPKATVFPPIPQPATSQLPPYAAPSRPYILPITPPLHPSLYAGDSTPPQPPTVTMYQRKSYVSHPWIVEAQELPTHSIGPSYSPMPKSHVIVPTTPAVTHYISEELPVIRKAHVSVPTTIPLDSTRVHNVEDQVQHFDSKFRSLINKAYQEVNGKMESSDYFLFHITCLPASTRTQHRSFIEKKLTSIPPPVTIVNIWTILKLYWDFLNYGLLEHVINVRGSEDLKQQMQEYVLELSKFKQTTRICDFIDSWSSRRYGQVDSLKKVVAMMQMEWSRCTLRDLESFNIDLVHKFFLPDFDIQLKYCLEDVDRGMSASSSWPETNVTAFTNTQHLCFCAVKLIDSSKEDESLNFIAHRHKCCVFVKVVTFSCGPTLYYV